MRRVLLDQAVALHGQGRLAEAERLYAQILAADPNQLDARHMLGVLRAQQGRNAEALELIAPVTAAQPGNALAWANHGNVLNALGRYDPALESFDRALALQPQQAEAWNNRGIALSRLGQLDAALESYDRALSVNPAFAMALNNRGLALQGLRRLDAALACYERALALAPQYPQAEANRADALQLLCRYDEAVTGYDRALALDPGYAGAWNNRGLALQNLKRLDAAMDSFRRAAALTPLVPEPHLNQGLCHLLQQDFAAGWPLFEWRKQMADLREGRDYDQPLWTGAQDIAGKTLFVYIERGLGDAIQFYRYAALAQTRGARVIVSLNDPLLALMQNAVPQVTMIGLNQVPEVFDYHISMMSLPLALGNPIPATDRYLAAQPARVAQWKDRLGDHGLRIGIAWQGNDTVMGAEGKSFPLTALAPIAKIPGARLINLQKNAGAEQLDHLPVGMTVERYDFDEGHDAFLDSAAILENLDLVIACDTALAHLAGALGVPAWIGLKHVPEWRWFLDRADSPWYPSLRLFRQAAPGDWDSVFAAMTAELISRSRRS
jgi:tetratricopeptide (TPR) repeat protein